MLAATKDCDRIKPARPGTPAVVTSADLALMERELKSAQKELKATEAAYGMDMLDLTTATRYVSRLLGNGNIRRYLDDNHPEILKEFATIISAASLDDPEQSRGQVSDVRSVTPKKLLGRDPEEPPCL
ncbi:hypothetical protein KIP88_44595 [Bradyrhizobium sp. SRL28]|nr:hypothetical protein [Bradyrhizobium sp. SRL28]